MYVHDDHNAPGIFQSIRFWQGWAVAATLAALFAFAANLEYGGGGNAPDYVAIVGGDGADPLWVVNADLRAGVLNVRAGAVAADGDEQYVLWVAGRNPQRVGVLPVNRARKPLPLTDTVAEMLRYGKTLAVSRQPADAAPAGDGRPEPPAAWLHQASIARI